MSALLDALWLLAASKRTFIQFSTEHRCQSTRLTNLMTHWTKYWVSFKRFSRIVVKVVVFALKDTQKDGKLQLCKVWIKDTQNRQQHYGLKIINRSPKSCNLPRFYWCFFSEFSHIYNCSWEFTNKINSQFFCIEVVSSFLFSSKISKIDSVVICLCCFAGFA